MVGVFSFVVAQWPRLRFLPVRHRSSPKRVAGNLPPSGDCSNRVGKAERHVVCGAETRRWGNSVVLRFCAVCVVRGGAGWAVLCWCVLDERAWLCVVVAEGVGGRACCVFWLQVAACVARVQS